MNTVEKFGHSKSSIGYVTHLILIECKRVTSIDNAEVNMLDGSVITLFEFLQKNAVWDEVQQQDDTSGDYYTVTLTCQIKSVTEELLTWLYANQQRRFISFWREADANTWYNGNPENGFGYQYSRLATDRKTIELSLKGRFTKPSFSLNPSFISSILTQYKSQTF
ncbi:hypothetical protein [Flectobacillus major]|uniref:hypothetical protein n=1 Tax=Flectobacillus major TaxID=103 RepID=UPI00047985DB|nr:hypothetical protein [Flectobacillus major]